MTFSGKVGDGNGHKRAAFMCCSREICPLSHVNSGCVLTDSPDPLLLSPARLTSSRYLRSRNFRFFKLLNLLA